MNKFVKSIKGALAASALVLASASAQAVIITQASNSHNFNWSFASAAGALSGTGSMTVTGFNSLFLNVGVTLNNTSGLSSNRLTSFGFGINPNALLVSFSDNNDGGLLDASLSQIPGLSSIEVCAFGGNNCAGGANGGILGGASDTFSMILGGLWGTQVDIAPIGFKYQTGSGSFEFTTTDGGGGGQVPEPASLALLGLGLLGLGFARRRKVTS